MQFNLSKLPFGKLLVMLHDIGQSPYNYEINQNEVEMIGLENPWHHENFGKTYRAIIGQQVVTQKLKKSAAQNCHEDNSNKQTLCINNFYNKKLGCTLPWLHKITEIGYRVV